MTFKIVGTVDENKRFCSGSFTKLLTTFVCLSFLSEKYDLTTILDDENFLTNIATSQSKKILTIFQGHIGSSFSIRDLCSFYSGLPYTFDVSEKEIEAVVNGKPFKHHTIPDEETFLHFCQQHVTPLYKKQSKFHYSEIAILFLGYFFEKTFSLSIESLYEKYINKKLNLTRSIFSRTRPTDVLTKDLSDKYDYPSIAILDHGYFGYSNGYYTTLSDQQKLLEYLMQNPIFHVMTDLTKARAASHRLLNGLTVELRLFADDIFYGYEGLSFSGCNIWAYSKKLKLGFMTFTEDEESAYDIYSYFGAEQFGEVPLESEIFYKHFLADYQFPTKKAIPEKFRGVYQRVNINESSLALKFVVGEDYIIIRNPEEVRYEIIFAENNYRIQGKDGVAGAKIGLTESKQGVCFMYMDGTLYRQVKL